MKLGKIKLQGDITNKLSSPGTIGLYDNIMLNAFYVAINGSLSKHNMVDGIIDEFEDQSGIDTGASTYETYNATDDYYTPEKEYAEITLDTKLLLHANGQDRGQEFIDDGSSVPGHMVHKNGNVALVSKGKWDGRAEFNGSSSYLTVPDHADWDIGTNFTIDLWVKLNITGVDQHILHHREDVNNRWWFKISTSNVPKFEFRTGGSTVISTGAGDVSDKQWHHIALCKVGNEYAVYVDGIQKSYQSNATTDTFAGTLYIGQTGVASGYFNGYMDELRITHNNAFSATPVAGLTDTITVPSSPHTSDVNTKLLLHFDGNENDDGNTGHTVSKVAMNLTAAKFGSGSCDFDGTNSYLEVVRSQLSDWDIFGSNSDDWTIDLWVKHTDHVGVEVYVSQYEDVNNRWQLLHNDGSGLKFQLTSGGANIVDTGYGGQISDNDWHHIAMCKVGSKYAVYKDGIQINYVDDADTDTLVGHLRVGQLGNNDWYFDGYIDEIRIQHSNVFNANPNATPDDTITVPTAEHTLDSNTKVLLHMNSHDVSGDGGSGLYHIPTFYSSCRLTSRRFGAGSCKFDGVDDDLTASNSSDFNIQTNFTIDLWVKHEDHAGSEVYITHQEDASNYWKLQHIHGSGIQFIANNGGGIIVTLIGGEITDNIWHHIALCKVGNEYGIYKDGTQVAHTSDADTDTFTGLLYIGDRLEADRPLEGYLDEIRIVGAADSNGNPFGAAPVVGLTDTITVPTSEHTSNTYTKLLLHLNTDFTDSGNTGHNITPNGGARIDSSKFGNRSFYFDGNSDYITFPDDPDWDISTNWTLDLWVKHVDHVDHENYITQFEDTSNNWHLRHWDGNGLIFVIRSGGGDIVSTGYAGEITDTNWHHVAVCKVGNNYGIYKDGTQVSFVSDASIDTFTGSLYIGERGNATQYFDGYMDEIRIQHSNIFSASPVVGLTDTITIPTAEYTRTSDVINNMTLISTSNVASAQPDNARIVLFEEDINVITLNTDLKVYVSRDGGTTYSQITLADEGDYEANKQILSGSVDISGQPSGTSMKYKIETLNNKDLKIHGISELWD